MRFTAVLSIAVLSTLVASSAQAVEYDRIKSGLTELIVSNPEIASTFEIGANDQGEAILGVRLEAPGVTGDRVAQLVVGTHHGNERLSADTAMTFARRIAETFRNPQSADFSALSTQVFYIVPVLNIGGFNRNWRYEKTSDGRTIDPNRDYPDPCVQEKDNFQLKSTGLIADFIERENIVASVTIHGYIGTFTYPWGIYTADPRTPDHTIYEMLGRKAVEANHYTTGTHTDIVYPTAGAYEDYIYAEHGVWVMLLELAHSPDLDEDTQALVNFFTLAPRERSGFHEHTGQCTETLDKMLEERP